MSHNFIHISIPKPCSESWDRMDATAQGAFCHSCQKEVIDFSAMTDREVVEYMTKHQTSCGRFRKEQLDTKLSIPGVDNGIFKWKALLLGALSVLSLKTVIAQSSNKVLAVQNDFQGIQLNDNISRRISDTVILKEVVVKAIVVPIIDNTMTGTMVVYKANDIICHPSGSRQPLPITNELQVGSKKESWVRRTFRIKKPKS